MIDERYSRQALLPEVGAAGQARFRAAQIRVAGRGTAARVCALYLAGAGVGRLELTRALAPEIEAFNPEVEVVAFDGESTFSVSLRTPDGVDTWTAPSSLAVDAGAQAALWVLKRILS